MKKYWLKLTLFVPFLIGIIGSVPQMAPIPEVLAQSSPSSQQTEAQRLYREGETLRGQGTRESLQQALAKYQQALPLFRASGDRNGEADNLDSIGRVYVSLDQPQQALDYFQQALPIWREARNRRGEASTLYVIGEIYRATGQPQQALNYYQQVLPLFRALGDRNGEANNLDSMGIVYFNIGEPQQALNYYQQAIPLWREARNRRGEAITLLNIGTVHFNIGQLQQALSYYQQALPIKREVGDRHGEAATLIGIGNVYNNIGQPQEALNFYQQALPIFREVGDRSGEATTLGNIGTVYNSIGQPQEALNYYQQALPIKREVGDRSGEANTLSNIGKVYSDIGQPQQALNYFQQSLLIKREVGDRFGEAAILNNIGAVYLNIGQPQQALSYYQQSLPIFREVGDRRAESINLIGIGNIYSNIGQQQQALNFYQQALKISREVSDRYWEANTLINIGSVYLNIGQPQQALSYYQQALPIKREVGDRSGEAYALIGIGLVYNSAGQPQQALSFYQQALPIKREVGDRRGEADILNNIGIVYFNIGQLQQALSFYQQALPIKREVGDRRGEADILNNIGIAYFNIGQLQQALNFYQQALPVRMEVGDRSGEALTLGNLARVKRSLNNFVEALQDIQSAIKILEDIRGQLIDPNSRTAYFASVQSYYKFQIDLLMQLHQQNPTQGYDKQAFNLTERSKARTLRELLTESKADIRNGVDPQLLQQERDLQAQITALNKRRIDLGSPTTSNRDQIAELDKQRETLETQYRDLQTQIRATSPRYAALQYLDPLTLEQIQQQILDDDTIILSYSLDTDRSYLWLVTKTTMTSYQLPAKKVIEDLVNKKILPQFRKPSTTLGSGENDRNAVLENTLKNTIELSNLLLKPIKDEISDKRLVIISDGALQFIPFGALPDPNARRNQYQPLLVSNEVNYLPSASTLQTLRNETQNRTPAPQSLAILADPVFSTDDPRVTRLVNPPANLELPLTVQTLDTATREARGNPERLLYTRKEADTILKLFPQGSTLAYFDFEANRDRAMSSQLSEYRFIHWATHGLANSQQPELSSVIMSLVNENGQQQNGYLFLGDIFNLNFNAELVVLSACETGAGEVVQGEGLIGLTRGLMYAGTSRVVTSLWSVSDRQTADLMGSFYEKMLRGNYKPSQALREAQLEIFNRQNNSEPYYWAAFTLQGEWR